MGKLRLPFLRFTSMRAMLRIFYLLFCVVALTYTRKYLIEVEDNADKINTSENRAKEGKDCDGDWDGAIWKHGETGMCTDKCYHCRCLNGSIVIRNLCQKGKDYLMAK